MSENNSQKRNKMGKKGARSITELLTGVIEPVLARKTGMQLDLVRAWKEMAGDEFASLTRPEKIDWPRRRNEDDPFEPAVLVVACDPSVALFFQHEQSQIIERVNLFFGFQAVKRIRIIQKPVQTRGMKHPAQSSAKPLDGEASERLERILDRIEDPELRDTIAKLGQGVMGRSSGE